MEEDGSNQNNQRSEVHLYIKQEVLELVSVLYQAYQQSISDLTSTTELNLKRQSSHNTRIIQEMELRQTSKNP